MRILAADYHLLFKPTHVIGLKCSGNLWIFRKIRALADDFSDARPLILVAETIVGDLASEFFLDGIFKNILI